jgi:serine/threonine protein kinase
MTFLHVKNIIHRDLALRNLLVTGINEEAKYLVKVADFGMSKMLPGTDYYKSSDKEIPVKWSAPEVLQYGRFSFQSDVFSFGITLWEIFTFGMIPYPGWSSILWLQDRIVEYNL